MLTVTGLAIREARQGPNHPDTATSLSTRAGLLCDQGGLEGARTLNDHPDTVRGRENLAAVVAAPDKQR
jgi:predicted nicotinamide N-methyase